MLRGSEEDRSDLSEVTDPDVTRSCMTTRGGSSEEDRMRMKNITEPNINTYHVTLSFARPCAEFVDTNTGFRLIGKKFCNEKAIAAII